METETGTQCIQMYTASASKYTVYKMYTRGGDYIRGGDMCIWDEDGAEIQRGMGGGCRNCELDGWMG